MLARMEVDVQAARLLTWKVCFLPGRLVSYLEGWCLTWKVGFLPWKVGFLPVRLVSYLEGWFLICKLGFLPGRLLSYLFSNPAWKMAKIESEN